MWKLCVMIWMTTSLLEGYGKLRRRVGPVDYFGYNSEESIQRRVLDTQVSELMNNDPFSVTKKSMRLRGATVTDTKNVPYMAAIIVNGKMWCGGALVDVNWVLTAAHCLNYVLHVSPLKSLGKHIKVRVGSVRPHEGGKLLDVAGAVRHPKFEEEPVPHADVALLKLVDNVQLSPFVNIIKIYQGLELPFAQSFVTVSGWGATRGAEVAFKDHTPDLMTARLKVRTHGYCMDSYQLVNGLQITQDFFCASLRNGSRDACLFDAGAPAVQENKLMGIMSFGPERCGHEYQPAVFIKAFYFRDFAKTVIASYKTNKQLMEALEESNPDGTVKPGEKRNPKVPETQTVDNNHLINGDYDYMSRIVSYPSKTIKRKFTEIKKNC